MCSINSCKLNKETLVGKNVPDCQSRVPYGHSCTEMRVAGQSQGPSSSGGAEQAGPWRMDANLKICLKSYLQKKEVDTFCSIMFSASDHVQTLKRIGFLCQSPFQATSPVPGCWRTPFMVEISIFIFNPCHELCRYCFLNLLFERPTASFTAPKTVTDSISSL